MHTCASERRETITSTVSTPRKRFDPTRLFAQRDRLPWFWFFIAIAVTVGAALDRYHLIKHFKQRERVVITDPAQTYYVKATQRTELQIV